MLEQQARDGAARGAAEDQTLLSMPRRVEKLNFTFTNRCNLRCSYCPQGTHPESYHQEVSEDFMESLLFFARGRQVGEIGIGYYGEMLQVRDWWKYCLRMLEIGCKISCVTNFSRVLLPEEVEVFARFREIGISVDTYEAATLREMRKAVDIRTITYNTQLIRAYCLRRGLPGPALIWTGVMTEAVVHQMPDFVAFAAANGIRQLHFNDVAQYHGLPAKVRNVIDLDGEDFFAAVRSIDAAINVAKACGIGLGIDGIPRFVDKYKKLVAGETVTPQIASRHGIQGVCEVKVFESDRLPPGHTRACFSPWTEFYLDPKGDVMACCARGEVMGRVGPDGILDDILRNEKYRALRATLLTGEGLEEGCALCPIRPAIPVDQFRERLKVLMMSAR